MNDFRSILRVLREHDVDFIAVGGVGAVLQGAPLSTFDLDVVHYVLRLRAALTSLDAFYRTQPERGLKRRLPISGRQAANY
ncbi:MAG: hypothetical protein ACRD4P_10165 [Bryobacteraceae bacterium]